MNTPNILTRRSFLSRTSALGLGTALATLTDIPFVMQRALADGNIGKPGPNGRVKKLLFLFLRGANDGLNALIPYGDSAYSTVNRPTLYIPPDPGAPWQSSGPAYFPSSGATTGTFVRPDGTPLTGLALGNGFAGLHPSLKFLAPVYNAGDLALLHRVGYPRQSRSHFDSQNYWETGSPRDDLAKDGILYRTMLESGLTSTNALTGVSIQSSLPLILRGSKAAMTNLSDTGRYNLLGVPNTVAGNNKADLFLKAASASQAADRKSRDLLELQYQNLTKTLETFAAINFNEEFLDNENTDGDVPYNLFPTSNATNGGYAARGNNAAKYVVPTSSYDFFRQLRSAALVLNKTDAIVAGTQIDGWDTHSNQGGPTGSHANLLRRVGWSIYALRKYFLQNPDQCRWDDLVIVTLSEFGRTTIENDDNGTDHAEASVMFVAGGGVKGYDSGSRRPGVFGCGPSDPVAWQTGQTGSMFQTEKRYLKRAIDYRSVLGKVIRDHLGATQDQVNRIIPGYAKSSEALKTGGVQTADGVRVQGEPDLIL
jgi:uncharacterized protein (DUF1501 family)